MKHLVPAIASIALSVASLSAFALTNADRYGEAVTPTAAVRTIVVGPSTHAINVDKGEIVKIVANGQEFAWAFNGTLPSFKLNEIAPQGAAVQNVPVYVASSAYDGASGS